MTEIYKFLNIAVEKLMLNNLNFLKLFYKFYDLFILWRN